MNDVMMCPRSEMFKEHAQGLSMQVAFTDIQEQRQVSCCSIKQWLCDVCFFELQMWQVYIFNWF